MPLRESETIQSFGEWSTDPIQLDQLHNSFASCEAADQCDGLFLVAEGYGSI